MADFYLKSGSGVTARANSTAYSSGNRMVPARSDASSNVAVARRWVWECTTGGTSGGSLPTWPSSVTQDVTTVTDGTVTWTARKPGFSSGSTADWSFAAIHMDYVASALAAGDTLYVSNNHAESTATAVGSGFVCIFAGTVASPCRVICVSDAAAPPTAVATTATVTYTGNSELTLRGSVYFYGIEFVNSDGSNHNGAEIYLHLDNSTAVQCYDTCKLRLASINGNIAINLGNNTGYTLNTGARFEFRNTSIRFAATGQRLAVNQRFAWNGGSIISGSSSPTSGLLRIGGSSQRSWGPAVVSGVDLSNGGTGMILVDVANSVGAGDVIFRNCKLPASWSGTLLSATPVNPSIRGVMHNCDNADTNYRMQVQDYLGSVVQETTIVRTGGASDGTTTIAWKIVSNGSAEYPLLPLESPEIVQWNDTTGSAITVTVEIITDNVTMTDAECWLDVQYLGTSGFPLGSFVNDAKADLLASAANQATSTETWTTTGLTTPVKQKLSVTFTPQEKGFIHAVVKLAKASTTVYVDPELTVA